MTSVATRGRAKRSYSAAMADEQEADDLFELVTRMAGTLEYGGRKVMIVACVLDTDGGDMLVKGYVSQCGFHQWCGLNAGVMQQLSYMHHHGAENF